MNIHEHQAKELLSFHGVNVAKGQPAFNIQEALKIANELGDLFGLLKLRYMLVAEGKLVV